MTSFTEENYLKAIYKLSGPEHVPVSTNAIADRLKTKAASVTDMLKKLSEKKLINYKKYQGVSLTTGGKKIAVRIIRKHRLWELFLVEKLNFKWDEVHEMAEHLEHIQSEELIERLNKYLGYPTRDPHGDPIPDKDGNFAPFHSKQLSVLDKKETAIMTGVVDHSPVFLQYLDKLKLRIGQKIEIQDINAFDHSVTIKVGSGNTVQLSKDAASNILVQ